VQHPDIWSEWLLNRRFGGDPQHFSAMMSYLNPIRDRVLSRVGLDDGRVLLDVGCGDGLIAFGALEKFPTCRVIFSDISMPLLEHARVRAQESRLLTRCEFLCASATDLSTLAADSVDAITVRSVLIYVDDRQKAFDEFFRVLKPGGQLSIFEPIYNFNEENLPHLFLGYDVTPVQEIAHKVKQLYETYLPSSDPLRNFTERDLPRWAAAAGFENIHLELFVRYNQRVGSPPMPEKAWEIFLNRSGNPKLPTPFEAMQEVLTPAEIATFTAYLRPLVEAGKVTGTEHQARGYLWAVKPDDRSTA
jgi:ubiquinone/menaquinone biosynthesis C-methylase UbiE